MKIVRKILTISIFSCAITLPIIILSNLYPYFYFSFNRFQVYDDFSGYTTQILDSKFGEILQYINIPFTTNLDSEFFSSEDILHMQDVRQLFIIVNVFFFASLFVSITLIMKLKQSRGILITKANRLVLVFILILILIGVYLIFTWSSGFQLFHQVLFPYNDYWVLDPRSSNLIKYLPEQIFQELALLYFVGVYIEYLTIKFALKFFEASKT